MKRDILELIKKKISSITDFDESLFTALLSNTHWIQFPHSYEHGFQK